MNEEDRFLKTTVDYHSQWLGLLPGELDAGGVVIRSSEERTRRQAGYPVPFTILAFVTSAATAVSYDSRYERETFEAMRAYDPQDPVRSLESGLSTAFGVGVGVGNKYYFTSPQAEVSTDQVNVLAEPDFESYREFFCRQHGTGRDEPFISEYFETLVKRRYCHGIFVDGNLASATDAPDVPYMKELIVEPGINTLERYRGRGLATAVCTSMIEQLVAEGRVPVWSCSEGNTASAALAERLGFRLLGKTVTVVTSR